MLKLVYLVFMLLPLIYSGAEAHSVHYQVENKGISIRVFYAEDDPASYSYHGITLQIKETAA